MRAVRAPKAGSLATRHRPRSRSPPSPQVRPQAARPSRWPFPKNREAAFPVPRRLCVLDEPFSHCHFRSFARFGDNFKFIHEPFGARQSDADATPPGEAILQRFGDIGDARAAILSHDEDSLLAVLFDL